MKKLILTLLLLINSDVYSQNNSVKVDLPGYKLEVNNYQIETYKNSENLISFEIRLLRKNNLPVNIINDLKNNSEKLNLIYVSDIFYDSIDFSLKTGIVVYKYKELGKELALFGATKKLNSLKNKNTGMYSKEFALVNMLYQYSSGDKSISAKASGNIKKLNESDYKSNEYLESLLIKDILLVYKKQLNGDQSGASYACDLLNKKLQSSGKNKIEYFNFYMNSFEHQKSKINAIENCYENTEKYFLEDRYDECKNSCVEFLNLKKDAIGNILYLDYVREVNYMYAFSLYMLNKDSPVSQDIDKAADIFSEIAKDNKSKYYLKATLALGNIYYLKEDWQKAIKCYTTIISTAEPDEDVYKNAFDNLKMISNDK